MRADSYDWTQFSTTFFYPVDIRTAFQAWATPAGLESFFIESAAVMSAAGTPRRPDESMETGDHYVWTWRHGLTLEGSVVEATPDNSLAFTFGSMRCDVAFTSVEPETTRVDLQQTDIPETAEGRVMGHLNCRSCWIFFMTNLSSIFVTGVDLRAADPSRVSSMEVTFPD
jgi:uncharacterized protein YndB with AHSA1/START domain